MDASRTLIDQLAETVTEAMGRQVDELEMEVAIPDSEDRPDALMRLGDVLLVIETKSSGYPRDVRDAIFRLHDLKEKLSRHASVVLPVFVTEHLSYNARVFLRRHRCGYFDGSGNLHLEEPPSLLIHIDRPAAKPTQRRAESIFTDAREQVLLALFNELPAWRGKHADDGWRHFNELLIGTRTAKSTLSQMLQELEKREFVAVRGEGRSRTWRLKNPGELLDEWAAAVASRKEKKSRWYRFEQSPAELLPKLFSELQAHNEFIAITGPAAAQTYSPWLTSVDAVDLVIQPGTSEGIAKQLRLSPADKGGNVTLIERSGDASTMFKQTIPGKPLLPPILANPFIAYLDTINGPGRSKELAMQLRGSILKI